MHKERIIAERELYRGKVFSVLARDIEIRPGKEVSWEIIRKHGGDSVAVVPIDDDMNVCLVEEYFGATNQRGLKLPMGMMDTGEDPEKSAQREMQEEIGLSGTLTQLSLMTISPGYLTQRTYVYLATKLIEKKLVGDEEHYFKVIKMPLSEAVEMCRNGSIAEARTIAGILLAKDSLAT